MDCNSAILFLPDDIALTKEKTPLMLQSVWFCPVLTWTCAELTNSGIERLFVVSDQTVHETIKPYLPAHAVLDVQRLQQAAEPFFRVCHG